MEKTKMIYAELVFVELERTRDCKAIHKIRIDDVIYMTNIDNPTFNSFKQVISVGEEVKYCMNGSVIYTGRVFEVNKNYALIQNTKKEEK